MAKTTFIERFEGKRKADTTGKDTAANQDSQGIDWDSMSQKEDKTEKVGLRKNIYAYMKSDKFVGDLEDLLLGAKTDDKEKSLSAAAEFCDTNGKGDVYYTPYQILVLKALGETPKNGDFVAKDADYMKDSEISDYVASEEYKKELKEFFMNGDKAKEFDRFIKNLKNRLDGSNVNAFAGWSVSVYKGEGKAKKEVEDEKEKFLIMALVHQGVAFANFSPTVSIKVTDENDQEVTDGGKKKEFITTMGWAYPTKN